MTSAKKALRYFKQIKSVKSPNNPFAMVSKRDQDNFYDVIRPTMNTVVDSMDKASEHGLGNCDEKGKICYLALASDPMLRGSGSYPTLCSAIDYDHVFVVVTNFELGFDSPTNLGGLGLTAMVVDGWTEDWYFPNTDILTTKHYGFGNTPNPRQLVVRCNIKSHNFERYFGWELDPNGNYTDNQGRTFSKVAPQIL